MIQTLSANKITLYDLEQRFQLRPLQSASDFEEWQKDLPDLSKSEKDRLEKVQQSVKNLQRRSLLENTVKLVVLAPLLEMTGLFLPPFYVSTEDAVSIESTDDDFVVRGRIDILVLKEVLWLLVIESKRAEFSPYVGIPQALSYMLAAPKKDHPVYGLVTNGTDFVFLKMVFGEVPSYGRSRQFVLGQDHDLEQVLKIMKHLAETLKS